MSWYLMPTDHDMPAHSRLITTQCGFAKVCTNPTSKMKQDSGCSKDKQAARCSRLLPGITVLRLSAACISMYCALSAANAGGETLVGELRCEYRANPLGIDAVQPRLQWQVKASTRGWRQAAYRILVASSEQLLARDEADLWDSGQVASSRSIQVEYGGQPLRSRQRCYWKVRVWPAHAGKAEGPPSPWSAPACWSMGLLEPGDWRGPWIGHDDVNVVSNAPLPARMLRKEFDATKKVARATVYWCGLGLSELYVNGARVGDQVLSPVCSQYNKRAYYVTQDVTRQIRSGRNALGLWLGNGRYYGIRDWVENFGTPRALMQLEVDYADGTRDTLVSDTSWKLTTKGPIRANNEYDGEEYDARREMPGWAEPGFDDASWQPASLLSPPGGRLSAQMQAPIRVTGKIRPVSVREIKPGAFIFDLGQNLVGWCRLKVRGPAGAQVALRHAELLTREGSLDVSKLRSAKATDLYTLKGRGTEVYEPRFTYHGFRYVEITGFPGRPTLDAIEGCVVNDDVATAGEFVCSNETVNRIYRNIVWGVRGNYHGMPTDCPQRDERHGWLGDRAEESRGESFLFDIAALYAKWTQDMTDTQKENGSLPDVCPLAYCPPFFTDNFTWPGTAVIIPGMLYEQYGDTAIIARQYPTLVKWIDYMSRYIQDGIMPRDKYGDWCVPPGNLATAPAIIGTTFFYHCLTLMAGYATLLERPADAHRFTELARQLKAGFNDRLYNRERGYYDNGSQTSCVLPLAFDMVPPEERVRVYDHLVRAITEQGKGYIGTGLIGGQWLNRVLTAGGHAEISYGFATNTTYPSWGYMAEKGATTFWELWNGDTAGPEMNSHNHVMLAGDLVTWLYECLAGIRADPAEPGFKHIFMQPHPVGGLNFVRASHRSAYGLIRSEWQRDGEEFDWRISVPPNTTATVSIPAREPSSLRVDGKLLQQVSDVTFLRREAGRVVLKVPAGNYRFTVL